MINEIRRRIKMLVGRCVITALHQDNYQIELLAGETRDDIELFQHFGFSSIPPVGSEGITLSQNGVRENAVIIATKGEKKIELKEGESAVFNNGSAVVKLLADDTIEVTGSKIQLNGDNKQLVTYAELDTSLKAFKASVDSAIAGAIVGHTHPVISLGAPTGAGLGVAPPTNIDISASKTVTVVTGG